MINKDLIYYLILIVFTVSVFVTGVLVGAMYQDQYSVKTVNINAEFIDTYNIIHNNNSVTTTEFYNVTN